MTAETVPSAQPQARPTAGTAWRQPQFMRYLIGQTVSMLGDQVWYVALSWSAVHLGSPAIAGLLLMLSAIPRLALMLLGGVIADRFDIRRLMMGSDTVRTVLTFGAAGIALMHPDIALLAVLALSFGIVDAVFMPSAGAMQPRLLRPEQFATGAVANEMLSRLALSLGAPLGGILVVWGGLPLALLVDGVTFAISVATLATVRPRPIEPVATVGRQQHRTGYWTDLRAGLGFLIRHPLLGPLTLFGVLGNLAFVGPMNIGIAELAAQRGWHATGIGVLLTGFGLGAAAGAMLMNWWHIRRGAGIVLGVAGLVQGAAILGMGVAPTLWLAVAAAAVVGLASGPMGVVGSVLSQAATPDELRGRVSSVLTMSTYGVVLIAMSGMGLLIGAVGITGGYAICAAMEAAGVLLVAAPGLRHATIER